jgi:peptidyl-tRNA hydrolase
MLSDATCVMYESRNDGHKKIACRLGRLTRLVVIHKTASPTGGIYR